MNVPVGSYFDVEVKLVTPKDAGHYLLGF